ncbi:MAG: hypothetical protein AABX28_02230 [Nanoarchaeota archaeon]
MNLERIFYPLKDGEVEKIGERFYLLSSAVPELSEREIFVPLYFAVTKTAHISHDDPVIGVYQVGGFGRTKIDGPFQCEGEAKKAIEERKVQVDNVSYEFLEQIVPLAFSEEAVKQGLKVSKYYLNSTIITPKGYEIRHSRYHFEWEKRHKDLV